MHRAQTVQLVVTTDNLLLQPLFCSIERTAGRDRSVAVTHQENR